MHHLLFRPPFARCLFHPAFVYIKNLMGLILAGLNKVMYNAVSCNDKQATQLSKIIALTRSIVRCISLRLNCLCENCFSSSTLLAGHGALLVSISNTTLSFFPL